MPGNPIDVLIEQILTQEGISYQEAYDRVAASFNFDPDASRLDLYFDWLGDLLRFDLGTSITSPGTEVIDEIARFLALDRLRRWHGPAHQFCPGHRSGHDHGLL